LLYNTAGDAADEAGGKLFFNQDEVVDLSSSRNLALKGIGDRKFYYAFKYAGDYNAASNAFLMLDADDMGADESNLIQYGKRLVFDGTDMQENGSIDETYFVPKDSDFSTAGNFTDPNAYFVARVRIPDPNGETTVFVDAADGTLVGPFPHPGLTLYSSDMAYAGTPPRLTSGTNPAYIQEAELDWGAHLSIYPINDATTAEINLPEIAS